MQVRRWKRTTLRAIVAVAALYAFALQAVLGGLADTRTVDPAHVLCLQEAGSGGTAPADAPPAHGRHLCCTAAHATPTGEAPVLVVATIEWPVRRSIRTVWRSPVIAEPRAPPGVRAGSRAPPVV